MIVSSALMQRTLEVAHVVAIDPKLSETIGEAVSTLVRTVVSTIDLKLLQRFANAAPVDQLSLEAFLDSAPAERLAAAGLAVCMQLPNGDVIWGCTMRGRAIAGLLKDR